MKKQELIKHIEDLPYKEGPIVDKIDISRKGLLELVKQLDEPQKPVVPQFVADWYEKHKYALEFNIFDYVYRFEQKAKNDFKDWFDDINTKAIQILVNMHQFGYEVEKEKKYKITLLNRNGGDLYLVNQNADLANKYGHFSPVVLLFTKCTNFSKSATNLRRKM